MMSSMQRKALFPALLGVSAVAVGATLSPDTSIRNEQPIASTAASPVLPPVATPRPMSVPMPTPVSSEVSSALARWSSLRQTDGLPFSSYASFLTRYRDWPGETAMRKTAERAINPDATSASEVVAFFPPAAAADPGRPCPPRLCARRDGRPDQCARSGPAAPGTAAPCPGRTKSACSARSARPCPRPITTGGWKSCSPIATR
jgi:soluble lytic murein transglycosylase